jgi:hypothetical protein
VKRLPLFMFILWAMVAPAWAQAPVQPTYWYWQVADTNPSTNVWEATSGTFVSNTGNNFTTWLTAVASFPGTQGYGLALMICNVANNGSGLVRITVCNPSIGLASWSTGQFKTVTGVGGVTAANGAWTITIVNAAAGTIDLQGSTFSSAYTSGGVIGAGTAMDTANDMFASINAYNVRQWNAGGASYSITAINSTTVLSNPVSGINSVDMTSGAQTITMPQANLFGSVPIGQPIVFGGNNLSQSWGLRDSNNNTIVSVPVGFSVILYLIGNASVQGGYLYALTPSVAGVNCSGSPTSSFQATSGLVQHC